MAETVTSPLPVHLASKVLRLTSENSDLRKRLEAKTESWRELGLQLRHSMILCDSLRLRMKKLETENSKLLGGYKSLLGKLKARLELMKEAERKYRESLGNPDREQGEEISTNIQEENIQVISILIFTIIIFCLILYKLIKLASVEGW